MKKLLSQFSIFIFVLLFFMIFLTCSEDKQPETEIETSADLLLYSGSYSLEPTTGKTLQLENNGSAFLFDQDGRLLQEGNFKAGSATLRIFFSNSSAPDAVYLLDDFTKDGWRGRWGEDMMILYKK